MRRVVAAVLLLALAARSGADEAGAKRGSPTRAAAQGLGIVSLALVAGGAIAFGLSALRYGELRDGCGARFACAADDVAPARLANGFGWGLAAGGIAAGVTALVLAAVDGRASRRSWTIAPATVGAAGVTAAFEF